MNADEVDVVDNGRPSRQSGATSSWRWPTDHRLCSTSHDPAEACPPASAWRLLISIQM